MKKEKELKDVVRARYTSIAEQGKIEQSPSCCGSKTLSPKIYHIMMEDYTGTDGYAEDADLGLGCGLPTQYAHIKRGDVIIDLGSGAGNDCFVARHETGPEGKVIGIDFTPAMIKKARTHAEKLGYHNVEFREGDIDDLPVNDQVADVVISNCVLNLVPDKQKVIREIFRVLKPGGHFSISDIVLVGDLPEALRQDAEMYAGCMAGAIQKQEYLQLLKDHGFLNIALQKEKPVSIPDDLLKKYLKPAEISDFNTSSIGIFSISVYAEKSKKMPQQDANPSPSPVERSCCSPDPGCC